MHDTITMTDAEFLDSVEKLSIPPAEFDHGCHVRLAWILLSTRPERVAIDTIRGLLRRFAEHAGNPAIYDDTLTIQWMQRVEAARRPGESWDEFSKRNHRLLEGERSSGTVA